VTTKNLFSDKAGFLCLLLAAVPTLRAVGFEGYWDITVPKEAHGRAWWLKIERATTANPRGEFVSAFDGNLNPIEEFFIKGDKLVFGFHPKSRMPGGENGARHLIYTAQLLGDKLQGTFVVEGQATPPLQWSGVRAPVIRDVDDGSWKETKSVSLFDGKSLSGWHLQESDRGGWIVNSGVLTGAGEASNLVSDRRVGLRVRYEVQIKDDYGKTPDTHGSAALYSRIAAGKNASKPSAKWQADDIRLVGGRSQSQ